MTPILIELAGVPTGKGRPRFARATGRAYTPAKTRDYESGLRYAASEAMAGRPPLEGSLSVRVTAYYPIPKSWSKKNREAAHSGATRPNTKPDVDNLLKNLDALNEIVFRDDSQIVEAFVSKHYSGRPCLQISIERAA
jgi:Holliday junction resolvase RusA-like endonuclease